MSKFSRLSASEIVTPSNVVDQMLDIFPDDAINKANLMLDIASKQGEFVYGVYRKFGKEVANNFYSIPTSKIGYEFTRKVYELLELDLNHIEHNYNSYDLIKRENKLIQNNQIKFNDNFMKFNAIVGNPPYQEDDGGAGASARPIYNSFVDLSKQLEPKYISIIMPSRWYAGGKDLDEFRETMLNDIHISQLHDFLNPEEVFPGTNNRGGICYFLWDKSYNNSKDLTKVLSYKNGSSPQIINRNLKTENSDIFIRHGLAIEMLKKIQSYKDFASFEKYVSARKPFGLEGNITKDEKFYDSKKELKNPIICYGKGKKIGYIEKDQITKNIKWIKKFKVYTPRANNIGTELNDDNLNTFIGVPNTICTESYIVVGVDLELDKISATNICKYFTSKFARFQHSIGKSSQDATSKTYKFVPLQDFTDKSDINWSKSIPEIDQQLYKKYGLTEEEVSFIESMIKPMS